jgi:hypothetical protein
MAGDVAGTTDNKQQVANEAAVLAISTLYPTDVVGVMAFSEGNIWIVPMGPNSDFDGTAGKVRKITPGGGTEIYRALNEAGRAMAALNQPHIIVRHIVLLTDGRSYDSGDYDAFITQLRSVGITVSTIGVGQDVDTDLLERVARLGGGKYYPIDDARLLPRVFIKEARTVRKHLIKERPFAPQMLGSGSPITLGLEQPPPLRGIVLTGPKRDARIFNAMAGSEGEPLFAHWQLGLGRTAAFTSDATNKWAAAWMTWPGYADFWTRTLRAIARPSASRDFDLLATVEGNTLRLRLDASSDRRGSDSYLNFLKVQGSVVGPDGEARIVQLDQTGPGLYEAQLPATDAGSYIVSLFATSPAGERQFVFGGANHLPGGELRNMQSNRAILEQVAQITGGRVLDLLGDPANDVLFSRDDSLPPSRSIRPLWWPLMQWLLVLLLLDVACRRIAWDAAATWRWSLARVAALRQVMTRREAQAAQTLDQLKRRAAEVDQQLGPKPADQRPPPPPPKRPPPPRPAAAQRKFEAQGPAKPSGDFASSVGAAKPPSPDQPAKPTTPAGPPAADGPTTSRLLDAKRRARERLNDPNAKQDS